jgi:hydrogenase/urease accessory protein HupE
VPSLAGAHTVGISRGEYQLRGAQVTATIVFARPELAAAVPRLDPDGDGSITRRELSAARKALDELVVQHIEVHSSSGRCIGTANEAVLTEEDGLSISAVYHCLDEPSAVTTHLGFLNMMSHGHRHLATTSAGAAATHVVAYVGNAALEIAMSQEHGDAAGGAIRVLGPLFRLGVFHILTGYDHLIFLFALILVGGRLRSLIFVVTAFTSAHSITLGLAALGIWSPSTLFVEPAIALSIAYVGVENWFVKNADRRWLITFPFGLVHGFGFAGALQQISLPTRQIPFALAAFNGGVEAGQIGVLLLVLPTLMYLRRRQWFGDQGVKGLSASIAVAGAWLFISRVV